MNERGKLRREVHDLNQQAMQLFEQLESLDPAAATAVKNARSELFEAWTMLCLPPEYDHDD